MLSCDSSFLKSGFSGYSLHSSAISVSAARGFLSNTIMLQEGYGYTFDDFWQILGPLGDYAWNPGAYDPDRSLSAWSDILTTANPCGANSDTS